MIIDNFDVIEPLLSFDNPNDYYYCQLLKRKKDGTTKYNRNNDARLVTAYRFYDLEGYRENQEEIRQICDATGARAGINLNKKSGKKMVLQSLKKITEYTISEQYRVVNSLVPSLNGVTKTSVSNDIWHIDVDGTKDITKVLELLRKTDLEGNRKNVRTTVHEAVESYSGLHIITSKFDSLTFMKFVVESGMDISIHKNNPVALYFPHKQ